MIAGPLDYAWSKIDAAMEIMAKSFAPSLRTRVVSAWDQLAPANDPRLPENIRNSFLQLRTRLYALGTPEETLAVVSDREVILIVELFVDIHSGVTSAVIEHEREDALRRLKLCTTCQESIRATSKGLDQ